MEKKIALLSSDFGGVMIIAAWGRDKVSQTGQLKPSCLNFSQDQELCANDNLKNVLQYCVRWWRLLQSRITRPCNELLVQQYFCRYIFLQLRALLCPKAWFLLKIYKKNFICYMWVTWRSFCKLDFLFATFFKLFYFIPVSDPDIQCLKMKLKNSYCIPNL